MKKEVSSAVDFLAKLLRTNNFISNATFEEFRQTLLRTLLSHYEDHWFPDKPFKGSGYRCIRINHKMDPLVTRAGELTGLSEAQLFQVLPSELTLWVDPDEVSYRIGEEGSIGVLFDDSAKDDEDDGEICYSTSAASSDDDSGHQRLSYSSSSSSSPSTSPDFLSAYQGSRPYLNGSQRYCIPTSVVS